MCFDIAQLEVYTLMEKDCYPRFLRSATFKEREKTKSCSHEEKICSPVEYFQFRESQQYRSPDEGS